MRARTWMVPALAWAVCDLLVIITLEWAGWDLAPRMVVVGQVLAIAVAAVVFIGGRVLVRRASVGVLAAVSVSAAAVAACPVPVTVSDGCNSWRAVTHAALVPYVLRVQPKTTRLAYAGVQPLVLCLPPGRYGRAETPPTTGFGGGTFPGWTGSDGHYTIVIESARSQSKAVRVAQKAQDAGMMVGILASDEFSSLNGGYYVVFTGDYSSKSDAEAAVDGIRTSYDNAHIRRIKA